MDFKSYNIAIFTDGSSRGNPGPGGWGAIIIFNDEKIKVKELGGGEKETTNNRMEITAVVEVFKWLESKNLNLEQKIIIFTDSSYLVNGITKWIFSWKRNGWKTVLKQSVENRDLWEDLEKVTNGKKIEWKIIGGHIGILGNEKVDKIATAFADNVEIKLFEGLIDDYSTKNILDISFDTLSKNKKNENRKRSEAKAYSYISLVDGIVETHKTWSECEMRVKGKSKVRYKKAISADEEKQIIEEFKK